MLYLRLPSRKERTNPILPVVDQGVHEYMCQNFRETV